MKKQIFCFLLAAVLLIGLCPAGGAAYTEMQFSDALVAYIKRGEGFVSQAINDGTGWYIGYGCLVSPSDYPGGITEPQADALLRQRMQSFADYVNSFCKKYGVSVTQGQFDAMCAMSYALGPAWLQKGNRLPDYLISGIGSYTDQQIASALAAWCHTGGSVNTGALNRRIMEAKMFLDDDYSYSTDGWNWLILNANGGSNEFSDVSVYRSGAAYGTLPNAAKSGMYFAGWQTADGKILSPADVVTENLRVTAQWSSTPSALPDAPAPTPVPTPSPSPAPSPAPSAEPGGTQFPDVQADAWFAGYVTALAEAGVVNGYKDGSFRPKNSVSWAEALKLVLLASGYPEQAPVETKDGKQSSHWASGYLAYAEKKQFIAAGSVSDPDKPLTRDDIADLCAAALELTQTVSPSPYADSSHAAALKLYVAGIMEGSFDSAGNRVFKGGNAITRAEICAVLVRVMDYVDRTLILFSDYRIPVDSSLRLPAYDPACFRTENGRISYGDGVTVSRCGIDVSEHQGVIDWAAVAADGIDFAMIRCGYRGYGKGTLNEDPYFRKNIAGAIANGLDVGVYFFSQALTKEEAQEEADYCLSLIRDYKLSYPVAFDWEVLNYSGSRTRYYAKKDVADFLEAFSERIAAAGYRPMAYYNLSLAYLQMDLAKAQKYDGWLAHYNVDVPGYKYDYQMWQYGSSGKVAGIKGVCDMDIAFVDYAAK